MAYDHSGEPAQVPRIDGVGECQVPVTGVSIGRVIHGMLMVASESHEYILCSEMSRRLRRVQGTLSHSRHYLTTQDVEGLANWSCLERDVLVQVQGGVGSRRA